KQGTISAMKLQKLVYYSQAWSLVWDDAELFCEPIQAWANGPVVPQLFEEHRGRFSVSSWPKGDSTKLSVNAVETIDAVLNYYGKLNAQELSDLTHQERPWADARKGIPDGVRGCVVITNEAMMDYYANIQNHD
ncbi:MAG: type II toxin-antitoxin system antitoxin SocA domain-containing protein, partial [bacterium]